MREEPGQPRVLFRCDAGRSLGSGHVTRCLALADGLAAGGASVTFASRVESRESNAALRVGLHPDIV